MKTDNGTKDVQKERQEMKVLLLPDEQDEFRDE